MERKQIQFTRQQLSALRREARRRRTSESALVREAVDGWMRTHEPESEAERVARALSVIGAFSSGGGQNIATEHDDHLADIAYEHVQRTHGRVR